MSMTRSASLCGLLTMIASCGASGASDAGRSAVPPAAPVATPTPVSPQASPTATEDPTPPQLRLPDTVVPQRYRAILDLDSSKTTFKGRIEIDVEIKKTTRVVWLNGKQIDISRAVIETASGKHSARVIADEGDEMRGLIVTDVLAPGAGTIEIDYSGGVTEKEVSGVFRQQEGNDYYLYSQFEAVAARRALPCFDEPMFKTPWQLTLRVPQDQRAFSNTKAVSETVKDGTKTIVFGQTKAIPSYLVAFAVGPFEVVDAGTAGRNSTPLRIIVPKGRADQAQFAVANTGKILSLLEEYFDRPHPYQKLDSIAVPNFFGAMENPGLVTYAQNILLTKPEDQSLHFERNFVGVAAHEIAHQWFGNLVTMQWWDDLWLNESFTSWISAKIVAEYKPEWNAEVQNVRVKEEAMASDASEAAEAIRHHINSLADIFGGGAGIIYSKGKTVIAMFESWIGEDKFRDGIRKYINKHEWGNATMADFLSALAAVSNPDLTEAFTTFIDQPGFPLVTATLACDKAKAPKLTLQQARYVPAGQRDNGEPQQWHVPICVRFGKGRQAIRQCTVLKGSSGEVQLNSKSCPDWLVANQNAAGYYRTEYGEDLVKTNLFGKGKKHLTTAERVGLIGDTTALVKAGRVNAAAALSMVPRLVKDKDPFIVHSTASIVEDIDRNVVADDAWPRYQRFVRKTFGKQARQLGWKKKAGESQETTRLRPKVLRLVADQGGDSTLRKEALALANQWLESPQAVDSNMVNTVLKVAALTNDHELYDSYLNKLKATKDVRMRSRLFTGLSAFTDGELVKRSLEMLVRDGFDLQEATQLWFAPMANVETRDIAFAFVKKNTDILMSRLPAVYQPFIVFSGAGQCDQDGYDEVKAFFEPKVANLNGGPRALEQVLAGIRSCIALREAQQANVTAFLRKY